MPLNWTHSQMSPRHLYQGKGLGPEEARRIALALFDRRPEKPLLVGPVSMEIGQNYGLNETERLLDGMVQDGLLRVATATELGSMAQRGYFKV
jgi:hypothetical protein